MENIKIALMGSPATTQIVNPELNSLIDPKLYDVTLQNEFYTFAHLNSNYDDLNNVVHNFELNRTGREFFEYNTNEFWKSIEISQPDVLIFDIFSEVYFGSVKFNSSYITWNRRRTKNFLQGKVINPENDSQYVNFVIEQIKLFKERLVSISPNTTFVLNKMRFLFDKEIGRSLEKIHMYNEMFEHLELALEQELQLPMLSFHDEVELDPEHIFGKWYYFYNQFYYQHKMFEIEKIISKTHPNLLTVKTYEFDAVEQGITATADVLYVGTNYEAHDLKAFLGSENRQVHNRINELAAQDYTINGKIGLYYRLIKRAAVHSDYERYENLHYRIINPVESKRYWGNHLLVKFQSAGNNIDSVYALDRWFPLGFDRLKDSIVKNTYILDLADSNGIMGSFYNSTENFEDYEEQIQDLIRKTAQKYSVPDENIVLYGTSRGGTGALLHSILGNYKSVSGDPVIDDSAWYKRSDRHWRENFMDVDLTQKYEKLLKDAQPKKHIILSSPTIKEGTYQALQRLPLENATFRTVNYDVELHSEFNSKTVPLQLAYINLFLFEDAF